MARANNNTFIGLQLLVERQYIWLLFSPCFFTRKKVLFLTPAPQDGDILNLTQIQSTYLIILK